MFSEMSDLDKTLVLEWFRWHMTMEQRLVLMCELPIAYNRMVENESVQVTRVSDGSRIRIGGEA